MCLAQCLVKPEKLLNSMSRNKVMEGVGKPILGSIKGNNEGFHNDYDTFLKIRCIS